MTACNVPWVPISLQLPAAVVTSVLPISPPLMPLLPSSPVERPAVPFVLRALPLEWMDAPHALTGFIVMDTAVLSPAPNPGPHWSMLSHQRCAPLCAMLWSVHALFARPPLDLP